MPMTVPWLSLPTLWSQELSVGSTSKTNLSSVMKLSSYQSQPKIQKKLHRLWLASIFQVPITLTNSILSKALKKTSICHTTGQINSKWICKWVGMLMPCHPWALTCKSSLLLPSKLSQIRVTSHQMMKKHRNIENGRQSWSQLTCQTGLAMDQSMTTFCCKLWCLIPRITFWIQCL